MTSEDSTSRIKSAASLLVKGGTLTSEACEKCGGVQVRFADKTVCINCGNESRSGDLRQAAEMKTPIEDQTSAGLGSVEAIIEEKIAIIATELRSENDVSAQKQKAELLESYLRILEKAKSLGI